MSWAVNTALDILFERSGEEKMEKFWTILKWEEDRWVILEEFCGNSKELSNHLNGLMKFHKGVKFDAIPNDQEE